MPSTFVVVKPELNLAYYSAYKLQLRKDHSHNICRFTREKDRSREVEVSIAHSIIVQIGLRASPTASPNFCTV